VTDGKDWSALEQAAQAMRRLNRALAGHQASEDQLAELARVADDLARQLEAAEPRSKHDEVQFVPHLAAAYGDHPFPVAVGESLEFDPFSMGGGRLHPSSLEVAFRRDTETSVVATVTVHPMFQGPAGTVHGGVVALIVDELMASTARFVGRRAFTARLTVNLRAPAPIDTELRLRAWVDGVTDRKITIRAEGRSDAGLFADAEALFVMRRDEAV
jgi:acyl-coenzyme A thioesterase PaaI-like protein